MKKIVLGFFMSVLWVIGMAGVGFNPSLQAQWSTIPGSWQGATSNTSVQWGINVAGGTDVDQWDRIIGVIKNFINYVLGFLGLIALIMLLFGWFKIVTWGSDEAKYQEGVKTLKNAAIGIGFIGISWFLVTAIFFVFGLITN